MFVKRQENSLKAALLPEEGSAFVARPATSVIRAKLPMPLYRAEISG
jgi:hypothetical protein